MLSLVKNTHTPKVLNVQKPKTKSWIAVSVPCYRHLASVENSRTWASPLVVPTSWVSSRWWQVFGPLWWWQAPCDWHVQLAPRAGVGACAGGWVHLPDFGPYKSCVRSYPYLKQIVLCVVKNAWFCGRLWVLLGGCQVIDHFIPPHPTSGFHGFLLNPPYHTTSPEGITGAPPQAHWVGICISTVSLWILSSQERVYNVQFKIEVNFIFLSLFFFSIHILSLNYLEVTLTPSFSEL